MSDTRLRPDVIGAFKSIAKRLSPKATVPTSPGKPGNPRHDERYLLQKRTFLHYVDPATMHGLEIGAFDLPMIEPHEGRCDFADYHSTVELRQMAAALPGTNPDFVSAVDYITATGYDAVPKNYDWIAASHVIEHIADLIGWLSTIGDHLKPGGMLFLGIPDKRYIFDAHRRVTTLPEALACHQAGLTQPSFYQVFDFFYYYATGAEHIDLPRGKPTPPPDKNFAKALEAARLAETQYYDVHCSVFTPESFQELMREMIRAALIPYELVLVRPTAKKMSDFSAVLQRV